MAYSHSVKYFNTFDSTFCSTNSTEDQTVYSDCATLGVSCKVYFNNALTQPVTGYEFIKFGGFVHEMNFETGEINLRTPVQCNIPSMYIYRVSVPEDKTSYVDWTECEGTPGPRQLLYSRMKQVDVQAVQNSVSASSFATISIVGNCSPYPSCDCVYLGVSTTTTTTIPPVNFTLTPGCAGIGIDGTGTILANGFTGGTGVYQSIAIGSSAGNAIAATPISLGGATSYSFTGLYNAVYYVVLRDSSGAFTFKTATVSCTNTTTTTSTTSTTTAAPICTYAGGSAVIAYTSTTTTSTSTTAAPTTTTTSTTSTTTVAPTTTTTTTTLAPGETTTTTSTTSTTSTTTSAGVPVPTVDSCGGTANLAIANSTSATTIGYTTPQWDGMFLTVCTITGSPLGPGSSDSFVGAFDSNYSTEITGATGKSLRIWVGGTIVNTISIIGSPHLQYGDFGYGSSFVILEIID
jgi:hypothetical protein